MITKTALILVPTFLILFSGRLCSQPSFQPAGPAWLNAVSWSLPASWRDFNKDGLQDIFVMGFPGTQYLLKNLGNGLFEDVTLSSGIGGQVSVTSPVWGDYDENGFPDLVLISRNHLLSPPVLTPTTLYRNVDGVHFQNVSALLGPELHGAGETAAWFDYDGDGDLDLLIAWGYHLSTNTGKPVTLLRNDGRYFTDVTSQAGIVPNTDVEGLQVLDFDQDGDLDFYLGGTLFLNNGNGTFAKALNTGLLAILDEGASFVDFDNDGDFDLVSSLYNADPFYMLHIFRNDSGIFTEVTSASGVDASRLAGHWGVGTFDANNDGLIDFWSSSAVNANRFMMFLNLGDFKFVEASDSLGFPADLNRNSGASGDFDNNGTMDFYLGGQLVYPYTKIFRNSSTNGSYLRVRPENQKGLPNETGACVFLAPVGKSYLQSGFAGEGSSYQSHDQYDVNFGVDSAAVFDVKVVFPNPGGTALVVDKSVNSHLGGVSGSPEGTDTRNTTLKVSRDGVVRIGEQIFEPDVRVIPRVLSPNHQDSLTIAYGDSVIFKWSSINDALGYDLEISRLSNFDSISVRVSNTPDTVSAIYGLAGGRYYWRSRATSNSGGLPWTDIYQVWINTSPSFTGPSDLAAHEDSLFAFSALAIDTLDYRIPDTLRYEFLNRVSWLQYDSVTAEISGVPEAYNVGDTVITAKVTDSRGLVGIRSFRLQVNHVNHAPLFATLPDTLAKEDSLYAYNVDATDTDTTYFGDFVRYRLSVQPRWLQIDSLTGLMSGTPVWTQARDTVVAIEAYDNAGGVTTQQFNLRVAHVNHPPLIASVPDSIAREDSLFAYRVIGADKDTVFGDILRYRTSTSPHWLAVDSLSGTLSGVPGALDVGDTVVVVVVDDGVGGVMQQSFDVRVLHTNHAPVITSTPGLLALEDSSYTYSLAAFDIDTLFADTLRYSIVEGPLWLSLDGSAKVMLGVPSAFDVGESSVVIRVEDGKGGIDQQTYTLNVIHTNHAPTISGIPDSLGYEDSEYRYHVIASDVDTLFGDVLTFSLSVHPSWLSIDSLSGFISGTPRGVHAGDTTIIVEVRDGAGGSALKEYSIRVLHVNHPPIFATTPDTLAFEGSPFSYDAHATDSDSALFGDRVYYRWVSKPSWLDLDSASGLHSGVPKDVDVGGTSAILQAVDDSGAIVEQRFPLQVRHVNHNPVITTPPVIGAVDGSVYLYQVGSTDLDTLFGDKLTYAIKEGPDWLKIESMKGIVAGVAKMQGETVIPVEVQVTDGVGGMASQSFGIAVAPQTVQPTIGQWIVPVDSFNVALRIPREPLRFIWPNLASAEVRELRVHGQGLDTTIAGIDDTTATLSIMEHLQPNATYSWIITSVRNNDGATSVDSFYFRTSAIKFGNSLLLSSVPETFFLEQNFPNPFNPATTIVYGLPEDADVRLEIFNVLGQLVYRKDERQRAGYYDVQWQGIDLSGRKVSSGVYVYRLVASGTSSANSILQTRKMVLLK